MSDFYKCTCSCCGQKIEFPADGIGQTVPCPTCDTPVELRTDAVIPGSPVIADKCEIEEQGACHSINATLPDQIDPTKLLPIFTDDLHREIQVKSTDGTKTYIVNLCNYTCTCYQCFEIHSGVLPRDFGRLCKHIIIAIRRLRLVSQLPPIAKAIAENGLPDKAFGVHPGRFENDRNGNLIYISGMAPNGWRNVFALTSQIGINYFRFGFEVSSRRWFRAFPSGGFSTKPPPVDESLLLIRKGLDTFEFQCPNCSHQWSVLKSSAGKNVQCKNCQHSFIPTPSTIPASQQPPTEAQIKALTDSGFTLDRNVTFTTEQLDEFLKLEGLPPRDKDRQIVESLGIKIHNGDAFAIYGLSVLIKRLLTLAYDDNLADTDLGLVCLAAQDDPDYLKATITLDDSGHATFSWPRNKLKRWYCIGKRNRKVP